MAPLSSADERRALEPDALFDRFASLGVAIVEHGLTDADVAAMEAYFPTLGARQAGARTAAFSPAGMAWLGRHEGLSALARRLGGRSMRIVRALAFDKSEGANWFVPWHQDRAADGSEREIATLERMVALRVHLDDCQEDNGPLEVAPGSHRYGRLEAAGIAGLVADTAPLVCLAVRGDIVAMRPLLVHRSQRARVPAARRVLHLEYAPVQATLN